MTAVAEKEHTQGKILALVDGCVFDSWSPFGTTFRLEELQISTKPHIFWRHTIQNTAHVLHIGRRRNSPEAFEHLSARHEQPLKPHRDVRFNPFFPSFASLLLNRLVVNIPICIPCLDCHRKPTKNNLPNRLKTTQTQISSSTKEVDY